MNYTGNINVEAKPTLKIRFGKFACLVGENGCIPEHLANEPKEDGYYVTLPNGERTWFERKVFEEIFTPVIQTMDFGQAIAAAREGKRIARRGWNGKGMWVVYRTGYPDGVPCNKNTADAVGIPEGSLFKVRPYLQMKCVDDSFQMWLASQSDILADDWYIVE